jgi:hypothetical protein
VWISPYDAIYHIPVFPGEKKIPCALSGDATCNNLGFGFGGDVIGITSTGLAVTAYDIMLKQEDSIKAYQYLGYIIRAYETLIETTAEGALQPSTVHNLLAELDCETRTATAGQLFIQKNNW